MVLNPLALLIWLHFLLILNLVEMPMNERRRSRNYMNRFEFILRSKMRSTASKQINIGSLQLFKKEIWCGFIFERSVFPRSFDLNFCLELMVHLGYFNALEKMLTRLNSLEIMEYLQPSM
jgi:hypothetical protein